MGTRVRFNGQGGAYFPAPHLPCFIPSGCAILDQVLGGGWAERRIINIVGDESTGKTLLAVEAAANYAKKYPNANIYYNEVEESFDKRYFRSIGLPKRTIFIKGISTVEDLYERLLAVCDKGGRALWITDSLDALSDRAEMSRDIDKATYGGEKPKMLSKLFRMLVRKLKRSKVTVIIISQTRDAIGITFGERKRRAGGKALDFYASQIVWLAVVKKIIRIVKLIKRPIGILVKAKCKKNKVGRAYRECTFPILFDYGVDDIQASLDFLLEIKRLKSVGIGSRNDIRKYIKKVNLLPTLEFNKERERIFYIIKREWDRVESLFTPQRRKYE